MTPHDEYDIVIVNARFATGNPRRPWADAVILAGDEISFVGGSAEAMKRAPGGALILDAKGVDLLIELAALREFIAAH
jgi:predicted amidohydrolase YtcJ